MINFNKLKQGTIVSMKSYPIQWTEHNFDEKEECMYSLDYHKDYIALYPIFSYHNRFSRINMDIKKFNNLIKDKTILIIED